MRLRDAIRTLLGLGDQVPASRAELNELRRDWVEYQAELAGLLDQLNKAIGRWSKREQREAKRAAQELLDAQEQPAHRDQAAAPQDRKAAIRARLRAQAPIPLRSRVNGGGEE